MGVCSTVDSTGKETLFLFNAKELDSEMGLYYYGARYLDPSAAMWLIVDPMWERNVGASPYNYCHGNPIVMADPDYSVKGDKLHTTKTESNNRYVVSGDTEKKKSTFKEKQRRAVLYYNGKCDYLTITYEVFKKIGGG